jgi:predicted nucleic acid-binding protein
MRYFDASALAKIYVQEPDSMAVRRLMRGGGIATSRLSHVAIVSALARRSHEGAFAAADRDRAVAALNAHLEAWVIVELTPALSAEAQRLLVRHALRSGDAVQLASCLYLQRELGQCVPLIAFDDRLNHAARAEGLSLRPEARSRGGRRRRRAR